VSEPWSAIAADNLAAAGELMRNDRCRSSVNRAYFAVYAAVTDRLVTTGVRFTGDREGPPHGDRLRNLVKHNLSDLSTAAKRDIRKLINVLYELRLSADYRPSVSIDHRTAREAVAQAQVVMRRLEVLS